MKKSTKIIIGTCITLASLGVIAGATFYFLQVSKALKAQAAIQNDDKVYTGTYAEQIEAFYEDHKETAAGLEVAVFDRDENICEEYLGYSNKETQTKVNEDTVIEWGSTTKTLVWVSVMQLKEQGKIDLEADVRQYLPDGFLKNLKYDKPVRMLDLMNHRAGFEEKLEDLFTPLDDPGKTLEEALSYRQPEQVFEPDTVTAYSNWGVSLAAYIVERISGENFADYVHANIFDKVGMDETALTSGLTDNPSVRSQRMELMCYSAQGKLIGQRFYTIDLYPAGMATSTLKDLATYGRGLIAEDCPYFESNATRDEMFTITSTYTNTGEGRVAHGFWCMPLQGNVLAHGGNTYGCSSFLLVDPDKGLGVALMTNQYGETVFNNGIPKLVFGENKDFTERPSNGDIDYFIFRSARVPFSAPLRIFGMNYIPSMMLGQYYPWSFNKANGVPKIEYYVMDLLAVPLGNFVFETCMYFGFIGVLFAAFCFLIVKQIRYVINRFLKKPTAIYLGLWTTLSYIVELVIGALFAASIICLSVLYLRSGSYFWMFSVIRVLGVISGLLGVWISVLMVGGRKGSSGSLSKLPGTSGKHTKSRAFVNVLSVLMALGMTVAAVYLFW